MEPRNSLTNGDKKPSEKANNKPKIGLYLRVVKHVPQWFTEHPCFLLPTPFKYQFSRQSNHKLSLFFKNDASLYVRDFLSATIRGNEEVALKMLADNPGLLLERGHVVKGITTDYSGRKYSDLTAFQIALCAGDEVMAMKMKAIFLKSHPETGQAELDKQFYEIFPKGYEAHLEAQEASADKFEHEIIDPLLNAFDGIDINTGRMNEHIIDDLNAALNKENNGSTLCQALNQFRNAFTALAQSEAVFNPNHLLKALKKYEAKFNAWYVDENNPHRWLRMDLFWRQVIGFMQRFLPVNYGQAFCTGFTDIFGHEKPLERSLNLHNYVNDLDINLFPLDADSSCLLGFDFAVFSGSSMGAGKRWGSGGDVRAVSDDFSKLISNKNSGLVNLCSQHHITPRCATV